MLFPRTILFAIFVTCGGPLLAADLPHGFPDTPRVKRCINTAWKFHLGDPDAGFFAPKTDDSLWEEVSVPHTLKLTSIDLDGSTDDKSQLTFHRTVGWYRKSIKVTDDVRKKVFLEFEGAHQVTDLWIHGRHVGKHRTGGYTPFHFDVTAFVDGSRGIQITLRVDNRVQPDVPPDPGPFDFIKFSGLYRDVYLVETDPVHITFNWEALDAGVFITTPVVDPVNLNAVIDVKTVVRNELLEAKTVTVVNRVIDDTGLVVLKLEGSAKVSGGQEWVFKQIGAIEDDLRLWSIDDPYLYRVNTLVIVEGKPVDVQENRLGIRKFESDSVRGFLLNEQPVELIGANRHQHYGYIGDALPDSLHVQDMRQFKQLGFNVVRTAHYSQDNALLDACDELGILVYEEAPTWISVSQDPRWHENLEIATRVMIRNHRNHPSVIIWGAGINHRGYVPQSVLACKQEDPTRLTASQNSRWTGWQTSGLSDIYANMMYGPGLWDRSESLLAMEGGRGPKVVAEYKRDPLKTGIISWTAHAYYTFHLGPDLKDRTRSGMMTVFREPKRGLMWYPSELRPEPYLHIEGTWEKETETLLVYSNAEEVELLVNGRPFMRDKPSADEAYHGLDHPPFNFRIDEFKSGKLDAWGIRGGKVIATQTIHTPETPACVQLVMNSHSRQLTADGSDILVGHAKIVDRNETVLKGAAHEIQFSVTGPASVVGDGANIGANPLRVRNGIAPVLIRAGREPGSITLTARAEGLEPATFTVTSVPKNNDVIAAQARPIYDFEKIRVDLGAQNQLVQFGWAAWNGTDNQSSTRRFAAFAGFNATLRPSSDDGILRWLGEMNVIGKHGFAYGEGVLAIDPGGLILEFADLPAGAYRLWSWHHAPRSNTDSMDPNRARLKTQTIHRLPYARELVIDVIDANAHESVTTPVTEGKEMQSEPVAVSEVMFVSDGLNPVTIRFNDPKTERGIWLNAFELSEWHAAN